MLEKIKEMMESQFDYSGEITAETSLKEDLGADSLDLFEFVMALEEEFDMEIPQEELSDIKTVQDIIDYLKSKGIEE